MNNVAASVRLRWWPLSAALTALLILASCGPRITTPMYSVLTPDASEIDCIYLVPVYAATTRTGSASDEVERLRDVTTNLVQEFVRNRGLCVRVTSAGVPRSYIELETRVFHSGWISGLGPKYSRWVMACHMSPLEETDITIMAFLHLKMECALVDKKAGAVVWRNMATGQSHEGVLFRSMANMFDVPRGFYVAQAVAEEVVSGLPVK